MKWGHQKIEVINEESWKNSRNPLVKVRAVGFSLSHWGTRIYNKRTWEHERPEKFTLLPQAGHQWVWCLPSLPRASELIVETNLQSNHHTPTPNKNPCTNPIENFSFPCMQIKLTNPYMQERTSIPQSGWGSKEKNKRYNWIIWIQAKAFF